jgi:hypothetical protein
MVFVIGVEDDIFVGFELRGNCLPESLEARRVGDDIAVIATEVLSTYSCISAPVSMR